MSRVPRSSLFYFLLVVVLGIVFYFTWQSIEQGQKSGNWTYSQLLTNAAQPGKVTSAVLIAPPGSSLRSSTVTFQPDWVRVCKTPQLAIVALIVCACPFRVTDGRLGAFGAVENETAALADPGAPMHSATTEAST